MEAAPNGWQADGESRRIVVTEQDRQKYKRLDVFLAASLNDISRTTIKRLFSDDNIQASDGSKLSLSKMPMAGLEIEVELPPPLPTGLIAENIPLEILFEDRHLLIINKPAGLCVHPAPGHPTGTLVNAVLYHCPDLAGIGQEKRPGIVHRLDMGTSGVMVVAKDQATHEGLVQLFSKHDIEREYEAITWGRPKDSKGKIETTIGRNPQNRLKMGAQVKNGKRAVTYYEMKTFSAPLSHIVCRLETGRTHQIRVHLSQVLHIPILCDPLYSDANHQKKNISEELKTVLQNYPHQLLHARLLGFVHPITGEKLHFTSPPPEVFQKVLHSMGGSQ